MAEPDTRLSRLTGNWVYGGTLAGVLLLVLTPDLARGWSLGLLLTFLSLPTYMIHQYEEHDNDRFRRFINEELGHGAELLTRFDVFIINTVFVWLALALVIAAAFQNVGWGVVAGWFLLVNGLVHLGPALRTRSYNPGLWTGIILFLPLGLATIVAAGQSASFGQQAFGLVLVLILHAGIAALALSRRPHA